MEMTSLDDDLAAWAATVRLPETEAAAIFQRITATPAPSRPVTRQVDPTWWRHFTAAQTARIVSTTRPAA